MIKEAIQAIVGLSNGSILNAAGKPYSRHKLDELPSPEPLASPLIVHTLSGLAQYIDAKDFDDTGDCAVFVGSPNHVTLRSKAKGDFRQREELMVAQPFPQGSFPFERNLLTEPFIVAMQSCFVQDEATAAILRLVGNLTAEALNTVVDDGVTQQATARVGIAKVGNVDVPNPVTLRPYRTFADIDQPASDFVLRLRRADDGVPTAALHLVIDNQWQIEAVGDIKNYLDGVTVPIFA